MQRINLRTRYFLSILCTFLPCFRHSWIYKMKIAGTNVGNCIRNMTTTADDRLTQSNGVTIARVWWGHHLTTIQHCVPSLPCVVCRSMRTRVWWWWWWWCGNMLWVWCMCCVNCGEQSWVKGTKSNYGVIVRYLDCGTRFYLFFSIRGFLFSIFFYIAMIFFFWLSIFSCIVSNDSGDEHLLKCGGKLWY